jgi:GDPmannose 4,6-dehydratase
MRTALITGSNGQDGSYLTEHLLESGYRVFCGTRRFGWQTWNEKKRNPNIEYVFCDVRDEVALASAIKKAWPDEIYNFAGQVYVPISWEQPAGTFDINTSGLARILKALEQTKKDTKVYQASSSEMFGNHEGACTDETPMSPTSPYGVSKLAAHRLVGLYRDRGLFVVGGILFNHESPRRGHEMVTRKIVRRCAEWALGSKENLFLGNMLSRRDWGFAGEYVKAMHLMLQNDKARDYVIGTGESHTVAEFLDVARVEMGIDKSFAEEHTTCDPRLSRTQEIYDMRADNSKAQKYLGWGPHTNFRELVRLMVWAEFNNLKDMVKEEATWAKTSYNR